MSSHVFVRDAEGRPLMPMSAAYARTLCQRGKAHFLVRQPFSILQLTSQVPQPQLRPIYLGVAVHLHTAELFLLATGRQHLFHIASVLIDLRSDLGWRMRRRAGHRRRRRAHQRYRKAQRHGVPFKLRRPSLARSRWRRSLRRRPGATASRRWSIPAIIRWRTEAITRTIAELCKLVPISYLVFIPGQRTYSTWPSEMSDRFEQFVATYGQLQSDGRRTPACMYCGTIKGRIEVEHRLPVSRGGTDRWDNLVLACFDCNSRKGNRTPEEAGMAWAISPIARPHALERQQPYIRQTVWMLRRVLRRGDLQIVFAEGLDELDEQVQSALQNHGDLMDNTFPQFIAKPIGRPRKQVFTARNYPLSLTAHAAFVRRDRTVKRLVRVNEALVVRPVAGRNRITVIQHGDPMPDDAPCVVKLGMLCEGRRAGKTVMGIVCAIHSTGRLTLQTPALADPAGIRWHRLIISPRQYLRVLSTERVIFLAAPTPESAESELSEEEQ